MSAPESVVELPAGLRVLSVFVDLLAALQAAEDEGAHPHALYHLRQAVDSVERAHRALGGGPAGAIVRPGEAEPVD